MDEKLKRYIIDYVYDGNRTRFVKRINQWHWKLKKEEEKEHGV